MAAKVIKELHGFSGNQILLMQKHEKLFVRKIGNISRNIERMQALTEDYPLPQLYTISKKMIDMDRSGKADYAYQIYELVTMELWFREFYDK